MTNTVFADQITNVTYAHGVLRVSLGRQVGENQTEETGTLMLPISQANQFMTHLGRSLKQLEARAQEMQQQNQSQAAAEGDDADDASKELHFGEN